MVPIESSKRDLQSAKGLGASGAQQNNEKIGKHRKIVNNKTNNENKVCRRCFLHFFANLHI